MYEPEPKITDFFMLCLWRDAEGEEETDPDSCEYHPNLMAAEDAALRYLRLGHYKVAHVFQWNEESQDYDIEQREYGPDDVDDTALRFAR